MLTPEMIAAIEAIVDQRMAACPHVASARRDERDAERSRNLRAVLALPAVEAVEALRAMQPHERVATLATCTAEVAYALAEIDYPVIVDTLPPSIRRAVDLRRREVVPYVRVRNVGGRVGRTDPVLLDDDQARALQALGVGPYRKDGLGSGFWHWSWNFANAGPEWVWSEEALRAVLAIDAELAALVADGAIVVEPLTERECRTIMMQAEDNEAPFARASGYGVGPGGQPLPSPMGTMASGATK
jgi:hypothetical protein